MPQVTDALLKRIAHEHLLSFKELPGYAEASFGEMIPMYAADGKTVTHYEAKISSPHQPNNGYVVISATEDDLPVVEFAHEGPTRFERLKARVGPAAQYGPRHQSRRAVPSRAGHVARHGDGRTTGQHQGREGACGRLRDARPAGRGPAMTVAAQQVTPFVTPDVAVIVQGMTGRTGRKHAQLMRAYGTRIVGGVSPGAGT